MGWDSPPLSRMSATRLELLGGFESIWAIVIYPQENVRTSRQAVATEPNRPSRSVCWRLAETMAQASAWPLNQTPRTALYSGFAKPARGEIWVTVRHSTQRRTRVLKRPALAENAVNIDQVVNPPQRIPHMRSN